MSAQAIRRGGDRLGLLKTRRAARGFTLVELMLVVVIIGVLSSFALPYFQRATARARRTEAQMVLDKLRVHFINAYENTGYFPEPAPGVSDSAPNPPTASSPPVGQGALWVQNTLGWKDVPFAFDGGLRMRYAYRVPSATSNTMTITVVGDMPGLGGPISGSAIAGVAGNYLYTETLEGATVTSVEVPSM